MSVEKMKADLIQKVELLERAAQRGIDMNNDPEGQELSTSGKMITKEQREWTLKNCVLFRGFIGEAFALEPIYSQYRNTRSERILEASSVLNQALTNISTTMELTKSEVSTITSIVSEANRYEPGIRDEFQ